MEFFENPRASVSRCYGRALRNPKLSAIVQAVFMTCYRVLQRLQEDLVRRIPPFAGPSAQKRRNPRFHADSLLLWACWTVRT
jgi:hypothetical protein